MDFKLNDKQAETYDLVVRQNRSCFITAAAGRGKSALANKIFAAKEAQGYATLRTAPTGKAASHIEGITVHRSAGMGTGSSMVLPAGVKTEPKMWKGVKRKVLESCVSNVDPLWLQPKLVCGIDEIFQLSSSDARLWYDIGMAARATSKKPLPPPIFLFTGDIGQFLPIEGKLIFEPAEFTYYNNKGVVERLTLPSILDTIAPTYIHLTENMRQSDPVFQKALDWLYYGVAVHPCLLERVKAAPQMAARYYFNNVMVSSENQQRLAAFASNKSQRYQGVGGRLTEAEVKSLLPISEEMTVYVGAPFTVTNNIFSGDRMLVSNGELVTVTALGRHTIQAVKSTGEKVDLPYVAQYLPYNQHDGKRKVYQTLPGYPGAACSIMKVQGETLTTPSVFAVWQLVKGAIRPLKTNPGALYTICSRVTELSLLYFDVSLGVELSTALLKDSLCVHPKVLNFLLGQKPPLWTTDRYKTEVVVEFTKEIEQDSANLIYLQYLLTDLVSGKEQIYVAVFTKTGGQIKLIGVAKAEDSKLIEETQCAWEALLERVGVSYITHYR